MDKQVVAMVCPICGAPLKAGLRCEYCGASASSAAAFSSDSVQNNGYKVVLSDSGREKLQVIKFIKENLNCGLKEAKDFVDNAPCTVFEDVSLKQANKIIEELKKIGATAEVE